MVLKFEVTLAKENHSFSLQFNSTYNISSDLSLPMVPSFAKWFHLSVGLFFGFVSTDHEKMTLNILCKDLFIFFLKAEISKMGNMSVFRDAVNGIMAYRFFERTR